MSEQITPTKKGNKKAATPESSTPRKSKSISIERVEEEIGKLPVADKVRILAFTTKAIEAERQRLQEQLGLIPELH